MQLVKSLHKYNQAGLKKDPILEIQETLKDLETEDRELLRAAGFSSALKNFEVLKARQNKFAKTQAIIDTYGKDNIFTTTAIKKLCVNYGLRFLATDKYKGHIPMELTVKIKDFMEKIPDGKDLLRGTYIAAPESAFELQSKPVDPLFFVNLTQSNTEENLYYLVHQWGTDISPFRFAMNIPVRSNVSMTIATVLIAATLLFLSWHLFTAEHFTYAIIVMLVMISTFVAMTGEISNNNTKNWDSPYK